MMAVRARLATLRSCRKGVAAVEFALILVPMLLFIMGTMELGFRIYAISVTNGAVREAARMASTGTYTGAQIDSEVTSSIKALRSDAVVAIVKKSYDDFTGVGLPEPITSGSVASGTYCYKDINGTKSWENDQGTTGLGGAEMSFTTKSRHPIRRCSNCRKP